MPETLSYCRLCAGVCGVRVQTDDTGRLLSVRGDKDHAMTLGYACSKGLAAPAVHNHPDRLLHPLKRTADGRFERIPLAQALDEIADRLAALIERDGADAVGVFRGTANYSNAIALYMAPLWLKALGSTSFYSTMTIDQSAKWVAVERLGRWHAGRQPFEMADVCLFFGANPLVSIQGGLGLTTLNPAKRLAEARERGLKVIVVDPRRTELARHADLHLQCYPGEDVAIAAGLLHVILREGWHDADFCARFADGLATLRDAVAPFTPDRVAARAGIAAADLLAAARMFAHDATRGAATSGTGPDMGPHSNLAEHLIESLNVVCGRYLRAGDPIANPGVMGAPATLYEEARPPQRNFEKGPRSRVQGRGLLMGEKPSGALADEILQPGPGQLRALVVAGGNPASALPDQQRAVEALRSLELLVAVEPFMTTTARLAHYILPPKLQYERPDVPVLAEPTYYPAPFAQYTPAVATPPGDELVDDWYPFWALAKRLNKPIRFRGEWLAGDEPPSNDALLALVLRDARVPLAELKQHPRGHRFELPPAVVQPTRATATGRLALIPPDVARELQAVAAERYRHGAYAATDGGAPYTHLLAVRRLREVLNTTLHDLARRRHNTAAVHPADLQALGLSDGQRVLLVGEHGRIPAIVEADDAQRPGVVAMSHGWGGLPGDGSDYLDVGANTGLLVSARAEHVEPINAMARMTALPVRFETMPA